MGVPFVALTVILIEVGSAATELLPASFGVSFALTGTEILIIGSSRLVVSLVYLLVSLEELMSF